MKSGVYVTTVGISLILILMLTPGCQQKAVDPLVEGSPLLRDALPEESIVLNGTIPFYRIRDTRDETNTYLEITGVVKYEILPAMSAECGAIDLRLAVQSVLRLTIDNGQEWSVYGESSDFIFEPGIATESLIKKYRVGGMRGEVFLSLVFAIGLESISLQNMWVEEAAPVAASPALEHQ